MTSVAPARDGLAELDDYVSGLLHEEEEEAFEERLFGSEELAGDLLFLDEFARTLRFISRFGPVGASGTLERLQGIRAGGTKVHVMEMYPGRENDIEDWERDVELVVTHLNVDLRDHERIDVVLEQTDGIFVKRFHDVQCDPADGSIYAFCEEPVARSALLRVPLRARVLVEKSGSFEEFVTILATPRL